ASSGWTEARKERARELARNREFFVLGHTVPRRMLDPYLRTEAINRLATSPLTLTKAFEQRVRALFEKGLSDRAIARALNVSCSTINRRTERWRERQR